MTNINHFVWAVGLLFVPLWVGTIAAEQNHISNHKRRINSAIRALEAREAESMSRVCGQWSVISQRINVTDQPNDALFVRCALRRSVQ